MSISYVRNWIRNYLYQLNKQRHQLMHWLIICAVLFNSIVSVAAASLIARQALQYANSDAMLICGGSAYKWVSLSHFTATGEFKAIQAPEDANNIGHPIKCANAYLTDSGTEQAIKYTPCTAIRIDLTDSKIAVISELNALKKYLIPTSRAPPQIA